MPRRVLVIAALASVALCGIGAAQSAGDLVAVRRVIDAQNDAWETATKGGDAAAIAAIFADSGVEVSLRTGKTWKGRAAIQQLFTEIYQNPHATDALVQTDQVVLDGNTAVEYGHYTFTYPPKDGQPQVDSGKYVVIWRKQGDGSWRILMDTGVPQ